MSAMGALSTSYNDTPAKASRPYDANRDGFVSAAGSGMLVVEDYVLLKTEQPNVQAIDTDAHLARFAPD